MYLEKPFKRPQVSLYDPLREAVKISKHWIDIFSIQYIDFSGFCFLDPAGQKNSYYVINICLLYLRLVCDHFTEKTEN